MSNKWITRILLVCTVCLIILGGIFKSAAGCYNVYRCDDKWQI